jgi:hypothetical protein
MPKVIDVDKIQQALDRAARNAQRGAAEIRAGKLLAGRNAATGKLTQVRGNTCSPPGRKESEVHDEQKYVFEKPSLKGPICSNCSHSSSQG